MADDVRRWSEQLASDPSSMAFLPLAEALRKRGQLDHARKVAVRGLERHPDNPAAHDVLARILVDTGDLQGAYDAWHAVLHLVPGHVGATKGMAFIKFQQGDLEAAERLLVSVQSAESEGEDVNAAIGTVRRSSAVKRQSLAMSAEVATDPKLLFADLMAAEMAAILLDADGLVVAGAYYTEDGSDVAADVGATLTGVSGESRRVTNNLEIGEWRAIVFETETAVVQLSPAPAAGALGPGGLIVLVAPAATPLGLLRRLLDKCIARARHWLDGGGAT